MSIVEEIQALADAAPGDARQIVLVSPFLSVQAHRLLGPAYRVVETPSLGPGEFVIGAESLAVPWGLR